MGQRIVDVTVAPGGGTKVEVVCGHEGSSCVNATRFLESALGTVENQELLREYYEGGDAPREHVTV